MSSVKNMRDRAMTRDKTADERVIEYIAANPGCCIGNVCTAMMRTYRVPNDSTYRRVQRLIRDGRVTGLWGRKRTTVTVV